MRTTLTLEDDVAGQLMRLQRQQRRPMKDIINEALRRGLRELAAPAKARPRFTTQPLEVGECLVGSIDNVADVLAAAEDERFR
jgi:hypothetical protein